MGGVVKHTLACTVLGMQVGTVVQQALYYHQVGTLACIVQWRLIEIIDCVHVGTMLQQQMNNSCITTETRSMQSQLTIEPCTIVIHFTSASRLSSAK